MLIILLIGATIYFINKKNQYNEAPYAAGINFDLEDVEPFLNHLSSSVLDSGFNRNEIKTINSQINTIKHDNEVKEIGSFDVMYKGEQEKIRITAEIHIEDNEKEVVLYMYSMQELVDIIDKEMLKTEENMD